MADSVREGTARVDDTNQCIWWGDRRVDLAPKAFLVLRRLMQQPHQMVTKDELLDAAWPDTHVSDGVLTLAINQLRQAFGDDARQPRFIETVHRRGYRWIGETRGAGAGHEALASHPPTPDALPPTSACVGRDASLRQLDEALARAARGTRQIVLVTGEAGIGKTTLVDELLRLLAARGVTVAPGATPGSVATDTGTACLVARGQCVDGYGASEAYMPLLEAVERLCRESTSSVPVDQLRRLAPTWLLQLPRLQQAGEQDELRRMLAGSGSERMVRELLGFITELTADQTLVLVLEDLHWSDHATIAALAALAMSRQAARLLVIASYRPADAIALQHPVNRLKHELTARSQCITIAVDGLTTDAIRTYLDYRFPHHRLPSELPTQLQATTSGNPLFLLNALDDFVQRGWLAARDGTWECTVPLATLAAAIPDGSRQMIGFRLHQLPAADLDLLETASVVGQTFATQALAAVLERPPADVEVACARLAHAAQFIDLGQPTTWPDGTAGLEHAFRHALYQQVLYAQVTPARRQQLHRRVAVCLENAFAGQLERVAPQLALQFERGADAPHAVQYRRLAAQHAMDCHAYDQVIEHLRTALDDLAHAPVGSERDAQELMICASLLRPMFARLSTKSTELLQVVEQIQSISARGETTLELLVSLAMLTGHYSMCGDMRSARLVGEQMLARAEAVPWGGVMAMVARGVVGYCQLRQGQIAAGVEHLEASMGLPDMGAALPLDPGIITTIEAAFGACLLGRAARALELLHEALQRVETARHLPTLVHVLLGGIRIGVALRDDALLERSAARIASLPEQFQPQWGAWADIARGFSTARRSDPDNADRILEAEQRLLHAGTPFYGLLCALIAADALVASRRLDAADRHLSDALALVHESGERWCEAELYRLQGERCLAARAQYASTSRKRQQLGADAEAHLRRALDVARHQGANLWELRASVSLARLLCEDTRAAEGRALVRRAYDAFDEGSELPDLRAARAVLELEDIHRGGAETRSRRR